MNLLRLAWRNITGSSFRSWVVCLCALVIAGLSLCTILIVRGAEDSLRLAMQRLGADIVVVPYGSETRIETALLMGTPAQVWMPQANLQKISAVAGVEQVSPQLYLSTLQHASCCSVSDMFLVAYDPVTDFTVTPWLARRLGRTLRLGEAVGGTYVFTPEGEPGIKLYGDAVTLVANMEPTGTNLDQGLFFTFDTARDVARVSQTEAEKPLVIPPDSISAVMVKVAPGAKAQDVAVRILQQVPDVTAIESPNLFQSFRAQITGLLRAMLAVLAITGVLSLVLIGLIFAMAANERRRELGVLRALGATRTFIFEALLAEALLLALVGASTGLALAAFSVYLFRSLIIRSLGVPFLFPSVPTLVGLLIGGLLLALVGITLAAAIPAYHISRLDPAVAMRE